LGQWLFSCPWLIEYRDQARDPRRPVIATARQRKVTKSYFLPGWKKSLTSVCSPESWRRTAHPARVAKADEIAAIVRRHASPLGLSTNGLVFGQGVPVQKHIQRPHPPKWPRCATPPQQCVVVDDGARPTLISRAPGFIAANVCPWRTGPGCPSVRGGGDHLTYQPRRGTQCRSPLPSTRSKFASLAGLPGIPVTAIPTALSSRAT